ncbi:MAG: hypothetical protein Q9168_006133 [Polycauliona sp. 1 TL-2023]
MERYVEAWPGMEFQIEVYFSREFNGEMGRNVTVGIKLDGGPSHGYHRSKAQINRFQMSGSPIVFDGIEKSPTERVAFRFGSMDENIDWTLGEADSHTADLSTIELEVTRGKVNRLNESGYTSRAAVNTPRKALDLSGQEIDNRKFTKTLWSLQVLGCVLPVPAETPRAIAANPGQYSYTSKDFRMLADKVDHLEEQLKESQKQTAALLEKMVGGIHNTIQNALETPRTGTITTPVQHSGVKRKRRSEELAPMVATRPMDPNSRNYYGD